MGPTLIIVMVGFRGTHSSSAPVKGPLNNARPGPLVFHNSQDVESRAESEGNCTKVHVRKTTEIRLHDLSRVSVVFFMKNVLPNAHLHSATVMHHQTTRGTNL